jgi:hypothetical protein
MSPESVTTREQLVALIRQLAADFDTNPHEWENMTVSQYLEALAAWTEAMDGYYRNHGKTIPAAPSWQTIADMLLAAKYYE